MLNFMKLDFLLNKFIGDAIKVMFMWSGRRKPTKKKSELPRSKRTIVSKEYGSKYGLYIKKGSEKLQEDLSYLDDKLWKKKSWTSKK